MYFSQILLNILAKKQFQTKIPFISCFSWLIPFYLFLILDSRKAAQLINPRKQIQLEDFLSEDLRKQFEKNIENSVM